MQREIIDYSYVFYDTLAAVVCGVKEMISRGWQPFGRPYFADNRHYQGMVKYKETECNSK